MWFMKPRPVAAKNAKPAQQSLFELVDAAVMAGDWTWDWSPEIGMTFVPGKAQH
jgi:hypothetical protein